jgi:hypothetical protein
MNAAPPFLVLLPFGLLDRSTRTEVSEASVADSRTCRPARS